MTLVVRAALVAFALVMLAPGETSAHVRWFVDSDAYPPDWGRLATLPVLLVGVTTLVLLGGLLVLRRIVGTPHFPNPDLLAYMEPSTTTLLAVQTGIALVWIASRHDLLAPSLGLSNDVLGWLLVVLQVVAAFSLITGLADRAGALLLGVSWLLGFLVFEPWQVIDQTLYLGIAIALLVLGRTIPPPSIAQRLLRLGEYERASVVAMRLLAGFSIVWIAFTEKLLVPEAGVAFLAEHPQFNVPRYYLDLTWFTDERFTLAAGIVEASAGLLLLSGVLTRVVILLLLVPFNVTVAFLPPTELLGHLPIFGIMYVLLLYGSGAAPLAAERRLEPALAGAVETHQRQLEGRQMPGGKRRALVE